MRIIRTVYTALIRRKMFDYSFHPAVRWGVSAALYLRYMAYGGGASTKGFPYLLNAHRYVAGGLGSPHLREADI